MAVTNMGDIKRRIKSVNSTEHITNAMKLVSAAKLRKAKKTFEKIQVNFNYVTESIQEIFNNTREVPEGYLEGNREIKNTLYIVVTSNRGLCGGFNSNIIKTAEAAMREEGKQAHIIAIGSKGRDYFRRRNIDVVEEYVLPPENISFLETHDISKPIIEMYDLGEIDEVILIYTSFESALDQSVKTLRLLPFAIEHDPDVELVEREIEYEPSVEAVFNYLIPKYVEMMIYGSIVESATCEHAARRVAMESATDNARDMLSNLSLNYNRARQSAITNEISEIVSGAEALK